MIKTMTILISPADAVRGLPCETSWSCTDCGWEQSEPFTYGGVNEAREHVTETRDPKRGVGHWVWCLKRDDTGKLVVASDGFNKW